MLNECQNKKLFVFLFKLSEFQLNVRDLLFFFILLSLKNEECLRHNQNHDNFTNMFNGCDNIIPFRRRTYFQFNNDTKLSNFSKFTTFNIESEQNQQWKIIVFFFELFRFIERIDIGIQSIRKKIIFFLLFKVET